MITPRKRAILQIGSLVAFAILLIILFKPAAAFAEMAARELRYFWWLILLVGLAIWLIWGIGRRPKP